MKRNLWIVVLLFTAIDLYGQFRPYEPLVQENKVWYNVYAPCSSRNSYKSVYVMGGDTSIGSFTYTKVQVQPYCDRYFFLRETDSFYYYFNSIHHPRNITHNYNKGNYVYILNDGDTTETLLYFRQRNWIIQGGLLVYNNTEPQFYYTRISPFTETLDSTNQPYPFIKTASIGTPSTRWDTWIEGIGSAKKLDYNHKRFSSADHFLVKCVTLNDTVIYSNGPPNCDDYASDITFSGTCLGDSTLIELHACVNLDSVIWELPGQSPIKLDGQVSFQKIFLSTEGDYPIKVTTYYNGIANEINKFIEIHPRIPPFSLGPDTNVCALQSIQLTAPVTTEFYEWNTYDTSRILEVTRPGEYSVTVGYYGCQTQSDTIRVAFFSQPVASLPPAINLCEGDEFEFDASIGPVANRRANYTWSNGETTAKSIYSDSGLHWVRIYNPACADTGYFQINLKPTVKTFSTDTLFTCSQNPIEIKSPDSTMQIGTITDTVFYFAADTVLIAEISNTTCSTSDTLVLLYRGVSLPFSTKNFDLCTGDSLLIDLDSASNSSSLFEWNDGANTSQNTLTDSGWHWFRIYNKTCADTGNFHINQSPIPQKFSSDTLFACSHELIEIKSPSTSMQIGNIRDSVFYFTADTMIVAEISNGVCSIIDSLQLTYRGIDLPFDTLKHELCLGDSVFIDLDSLSNYRFTWDDGKQNSHRFLSSNKDQVFMLQFQGSKCLKNAWVQLDYHPAIPQLFPNSPYVLCFGQPIKLAIPSPYQITMNRQQVLNELVLDKEQIYSFTVSDSFLCNSSQTLSTKLVSKETVLDTTICLNEQVLLITPTNFSHSIPVELKNFNGHLYYKQLGFYEIYTDNLGCVSQSMHLEIYPCELYIPTAFSPNNDGINDTFKPELEQIYAELKIYDRWGEIVYQYSGKHPEWDGKLNGVTCMDGIYIFELILPNYQGKTKKINGTITLLH